MNVITKTLMIGLAVIFDLIETLITLLGVGILITPILTIFEYLIFGVWFYFEGIKFTGKTKTGSTMLTTFLMEMIPIIGSLPALTVGVYMSIKSHEGELAEKAKNRESEPQDNNENVIRTKRRGA